MQANGHAKELRSRFVEYFSAHATSHANPTPEDYEALELEKDNLLSAIDLAFASADWMSLLRLRLALEEFLDVHGYWEDAIRTGKQALRAARELGGEVALSQFAHNLGVMHHNRGDLEEARRLYQESLDIKKKLGNQSGIAISLHQLGMLAQDQGDLEEARRLYQESLDIEKKLGNQRGIAISLHQLAMLAQDQGDLEEARRLYNESLDINKKLGNQSGIASLTSPVGEAGARSGRP